MAPVLSAPKVVLLAVQLATISDIDSLAFLAAQHSSVLRIEILLRILLTYLPETLKSTEYVSLIESIASGELEDVEPVQIDRAQVESLSDEEAAKKVRKLRLLPLSWPEAPADAVEDATTLFVLHRAHKVDEEAGLLTQLPDLLVPFLGHSPCIRTWMISTLLPLVRRNFEYHPQHGIPQTLAAFERLDDRAAVSLLLSQTGAQEEDLPFVGRDLKGLIGPWLYDHARWTTRRSERDTIAPDAPAPDQGSMLCPGWEQVLEWLTMQASKSWRVAVSAIEQWDGPGDVDLGGYGSMWLDEKEQEYLKKRYARAALASAYLIPEASVEALNGANTIVTTIMGLLEQDPSPALQTAASLLPPMPELYEDDNDMLTPRNATHIRNDLLDEFNALTSPCRTSTQLLHALILSAFLLTRAGLTCTVRRAGELALLQNQREQKSQAVKLIHSISNGGPRSDDKYWIKARNELLWLRDWGAEEAGVSTQSKGVFGQLSKEFLEIEILKAFLNNARYSLARAVYEESPEKPLPEKLLQDTVLAAAMSAYDNASNPNRTRGGLKKCDDILHAFPQTVPTSLEAAQQLEALLKATHALSDYRLVLKIGEPFTPVVLRVHPDPISIIGKVLEQNPKSYTNIQSMLDFGSNLIKAGITVRDKSGHAALKTEQLAQQLSIAEKRITAMCIDAALVEDDFETAYSYVVNRLAEIGESAQAGGAARRSSSLRPSGATAVSAKPATGVVDEWSWKAALQAGKYRRTGRTVRPTHLGNASANLDVRHLEQRIECLATALRIAPPATLQEILNAFRRCEEELDSAVKAEAEQEDAWDAEGDVQSAGSMPGGFGSAPVPVRNVRAVGRSAAGASSRQQVEEAPVSLFDLSRASARAAQRNFSALTSLQRSGEARDPDAGTQEPSGQGGAQRVRKRDQLRDAAMGTLVSGVGWMLGAQPVDRSHERD